MLGIPGAGAVGDEDDPGSEEFGRFLEELKPLAGLLDERVDHGIAMPVLAGATHLLEVRVQQHRELLAIGSHRRIGEAPLERQHGVQVLVLAGKGVRSRAHGMTLPPPGRGVGRLTDEFRGARGSIGCMQAMAPAASPSPTAPEPTDTTSAPPAIRMRGVVKRYGSVTAVSGLDLDVPAGTCVGLLGPNGAGKSTTMKMLTAQAIADEGELSVLGFALPGESKQARAQCGVVPQLDNLDVSLTVEQNLTVFAHLYRVPRGERAAAVQRAMEIAKLTERAEAKADELSGGMRRRLLIARALVHRPRLVLLDEPTVGLDPQVRQELWALIDALRAGGTTILMSTHYIEEAERLCDTVVVVSAGRAVAKGHPDELTREHAGEEAVEVYGPPARLAEVEAEARGNGFTTRRTGTSVAILGAESGGALPEGERRPTTLEDAFVVLTGEEIE